MPEFATSFGYRKRIENNASSKGFENTSATDIGLEPVSHDDNVMVVFRECHIRKKEGSIFHGNDNHVNLTISFQMKTGEQSYFSFPATRYPTGVIPLQDVVILPPIQITDYFSLTVNMISTSDLKSASKEISSVMPNVSDIVKSIPIGGNATSTSVGILGDIVNIIAALSPETSLIHNQRSYLVDKNRYPKNDDMEYLMLGKMDIYEDNDENRTSWRDGKYMIKNQNNEDEEATRITIEFFKCP